MKKVLFITYYWPPAGGPGVQRVLKFSKYLSKFGWQPIILTVEKGNFPSTDESLLNEIPSDCKVYRTKCFEPFELYKSLTGRKGKDNIPTFVLNRTKGESWFEKSSRFLRANVFIPDAKIGWLSYLVREGLNIIELEKPDLIFSSSPPHSLQIGAMKLAKKSNLKWVADFRDPWSQAFWQAEIKRLNFAANRDNKYERSVLSSASAVISVSKSITKDFAQIYENNYFVIPNGYDETDFEKLIKEKDEKFTIIYTGTLSKSQRIDNLIIALNKLDAKTKSNIKVNFYGTIHPDIINSIQNSGLTEIINILPQVSHDKIIQIMKNADMLLLVIPDTAKNKGILTGKIFEYMGSENYILGIGPVDGDAAKILFETESGSMYDFEDSLFEIINEQYNNWVEDKKNKVDKKFITKYSRQNLTERLADIFMEVL